jgi:hypothetical protein
MIVEHKLYVPENSAHRNVLIYLYNKQCWLLAWFFRDNLLLLRDFGPYVIIFMNVYVAITIAIVW